MSDFKKFCTDEKLSPVQVVGARKAWQHQQSKIDELQKQVGDLIYKAKLRESDHQALLVKYQATKKCWEDVSGKCEELKTQLNNMEACYIEKKKQVEDRQKRIDDGLEKIHQFGKEGCLFPEWLIWAEKTLRGAND